VKILAVSSVQADTLPWISEADMVEVDRIMIEDLRIELIQMMENAGRQLAHLVLDAASPATVAVAAGSGGNGGGGLVAARHLANAGVEVAVATTRPRAQMSPATSHQFDILQRMGIDRVDSLPKVDVAIDALIGYSLRGAPHGATESLIASTKRGAAVVSLDTPSGLDVTTGDIPGAVVSADATMTLALPKTGLRHSVEVGELYVADISVPPSVGAAFGADAPPFGPDGLLRVV
jgi:NAD(P)H-hydrate epimerase